MKKTLLIASIIGLFMAASMDLQARYRGNDQQRHGRSVISSSRSRQAPTHNRTSSYSQYGNRQGRDVRGGYTIDRSRQAPSRDRSNSYSRYGNRNNSYSQYGNRYNNYSRYNNYPGRYGRGGISFGLSVYAPMLDRYNSYGRYYNQPGRYVASEIRRNEERIWILEERMDRLYRYGDNYGEIRELEQEINYLQRRNDFLRSQLY
jgi:hypothetical protein